MIRFTDPKGKDRNAFIKPINEINQIIKHTFASSIVDDTGMVYQGLSNIELGYHMAKTTLHKHLHIPEGYMLKIDNVELYKIIKDFKKNISAYVIHEGYAAFILDDGTPKIFGKLDKEFDEYKQYLSKYKPLLDGELITNVKVEDDEIEDLINKLVVTKVHNGLQMIVTHKILPALKKCDECNVDIINIDENFFIGRFNIVIGDLTTSHVYRFLKL